MRAIIGLGNPGDKYAHTRHNAGFDTVAILAQKEDIPMRRLRCKAIVGEGLIDSEKAVLVLPQTFMNESGLCVQEILHYYKLEPREVLIVHDDIDLPMGKVRVRPFGGAGTHNGMRSIIGISQSDRFPRIRIGVGSQPEQWDLADWVLSGYPDEESRKIMFDAFTRAAEAARMFITDGIDLAMNRYN